MLLLRLLKRAAKSNTSWSQWSPLLSFFKPKKPPAPEKHQVRCDTEGGAVGVVYRFDDLGNPQVVVIGAGVSGLTCAKCLREQGKAVLVLESADGVGGRSVKTPMRRWQPLPPSRTDRPCLLSLTASRVRTDRFKGEWAGQVRPRDLCPSPPGLTDDGLARLVHGTGFLLDRGFQVFIEAYPAVRQGLKGLDVKGHGTFGDRRACLCSGAW